MSNQEEISLPTNAVFLNSLIKREGLNIGAELGVRRGELTTSLLYHNPQLSMVSVDLWNDHEDIVESHSHDSNYEQFIRILEENKISERCKIIRKLTTEACDDIEDESLDFIYVDATHTSEAVSKDLTCWIPKVKESGFICGHDYHIAWGMIPVFESLGGKEALNVEDCTSWWLPKRDLIGKWKEL